MTCQPRIAEQDEGAASGQDAQPTGDPVGHRTLVADIAGGHDFPLRIDRVEQICCPHRNIDIVE